LPDLSSAMLILDHVSISVPSVEIARPFYDAVMAALGVAKVYDRPDALGYGVRCTALEDFHSCLAVYQSSDANLDSKRHWCFKATTRAQVREFHSDGLAHGGKDDGAPGLRPQYHPHYYGAFLLDPFGNRVEAVCHRAEEI
jgi:catechol 2,3-dioxygenase-like lactoylglutathione lyase family enzyme